MVKSDKPMREISELIKYVGDDETVLAVLLFGSRAREENTSQSDTDLCVVLEPSSALDELAMSRRKHSLLSRTTLDISLLQQLPVFMQHRVLRDARILFVRDEGRLYEIASQVVRRYEDMRYRHEAYLEAVAHG